MTLSNPLARQELVLAKDFNIGDSTFTVYGRFTKTSSGATNPYQVGAQMVNFSSGEAITLQEGGYINITSDPTYDSAKGTQGSAKCRKVSGARLRERSNGKQRRAGSCRLEGHPRDGRGFLSAEMDWHADKCAKAAQKLS